MTEQDSIEGALQALRHAAARGDSNGCIDATARLLRRLPPAQALELARLQVQHRLQAFERHQPGVMWPRDFLESLRVADPAGEGRREWDWENADFPGPGANSFISGVDNLWQARRLLPSDPRRIELLADAIAAAIQADATEAWGTRHPDRWTFWYEHALVEAPAVDRERTQVLVDLKNDPESVRIRREGWLEVAAQLAQALGVQPPP